MPWLHEFVISGFERTGIHHADPNILQIAKLQGDAIEFEQFETNISKLELALQRGDPIRIYIDAHGHNAAALRADEETTKLISLTDLAYFMTVILAQQKLTASPVLISLLACRGAGNGDNNGPINSFADHLYDELLKGGIKAEIHARIETVTIGEHSKKKYTIAETAMAKYDELLQKAFAAKSQAQKNYYGQAIHQLEMHHAAGVKVIFHTVAGKKLISEAYWYAPIRRLKNHLAHLMKIKESLMVDESVKSALKETLTTFHQACQQALTDYLTANNHLQGQTTLLKQTLLEMVEGVRQQLHELMENQGTRSYFSLFAHQDPCESLYKQLHFIEHTIAKIIPEPHLTKVTPQQAFQNQQKQDIYLRVDLFMNEIIREINAYMASHRNEILHNTKDRKETIKAIMQAIYEVSGDQVNVNKIFEDDIPAFPHVKVANKFFMSSVHFGQLLNLIHHLKDIKTGLANKSELRDKLLQVMTTHEADVLGTGFSVLNKQLLQSHKAKNDPLIAAKEILSRGRHK